jgi:hypothetical protein
VLGLLQDLENIRADRLRIGMLSVAKATFDGQKVDSVQVHDVLYDAALHIDAPMT